jgi:tRNA (uracil-5-)-methyltransferase
LTCQVSPEHYQQQLYDKIERVRGLLSLATEQSIHLAPSPVAHYRMRAEFRVWHKEDVWHYAMFDVANKRPVFIEDCPMVVESINALMQPLRVQLLAQPLLSHKLYAIDFLASSQGEVLVTLIYKTPLTPDWDDLVRALTLPDGVMVMGRSRGKKRVLVRDYVNETLSLPSGDSFTLRHVENAFSQPNAAVNAQMLAWVDAQLSADTKYPAILELYGGAGNFTWVLARHAHKLLMTELSPSAVSAAQDAFAQAGIHHVTIAAMNSEQVSGQLSSTGEGTKLNWQGQDYDFRLVMVDPPRAGLDDVTRILVQRFETIVYVSCNPDTLARDMLAWQETHRLASVAVFDQFPYTHHIEVGVMLVKK